jgi:transposase
MVSDYVGVYEEDTLVQYLVYGLPTYSHHFSKHNAFRFYTSNLIYQGLCRKADISRCFHVSESSVERYYKIFVEVGESGFFAQEIRAGRPNKIIGEKKDRIQSKLNKGLSNSRIAREEGITESAIRAAIKSGQLKKNSIQRQ